METYTKRSKAPSISNCSHIAKMILDQPIASPNNNLIEGRGAVPERGRKSFSLVETNTAEATAALLGIKVMAADMPPFMQVHAFRCSRRAYDGQDKFSSRQIAHDVKKEFDKVYGLTWHCIVGMSFGSFVTHSRGCFIYFSMGKIIVMLFKTGVRVKNAG